VHIDVKIWKSGAKRREHLLDAFLARLDARKLLVLDQVIGNRLVDNAHMLTSIHALVEPSKDACRTVSHRTRSFPVRLPRFESRR
jgi:hypothetical protein